MNISTLRFWKSKKLIVFAFLFLNITYAFSQFAGGTGTIADPYQIANVTQLQAMNTALDKHFILTQNIDASDTKNWNSGLGFEPIGPTTATAFTGTFNGNGYKIIKLTIMRQATTGVGLFGNFNNFAGAISNVGLDSVVVVGNERVGALVGNKNGIVTNCYATGSVNGAKSTGGLVGRNGLLISDSYSACSVGGTEEVGGLVGVGSNIVNSYATGNVFASLGDAGGLVGEVTMNAGTIYKCYATGNVTSTNTLYAIGGFIGRSQAGTIDLCYSTGKVSGNGVVGGFIGTLNSGTVKRSYAKCTMTLGGGTFPFGGFIAENEGNVVDCYSDVNMSYTGNNISAKLGGFAGENKDGASIRNAYSVANMTASNGNRAAFVHTNVVSGTDSGKLYNCYWNSDSSNTLPGIFLDQTNNQTTIGLTDVQMKTAASFPAWNFDTTWTITEGQTYPMLRTPGSGGGCTNTFANDSIRACKSYTWLNGITYTSSTDTPTFILPNAAGCDSIVTLRLTIDTINNGISRVNNVLTAADNRVGTTYQWINCDSGSPIPNALSASYTVTTTGNYAVVVTNNSCTDTSACENVVIVGIDVVKNQNIQVYPNPATSEINFILKQKSELKIIDALGRLVFIDTFDVGAQKIIIADFENGIYYISINDGDNHYVNRILIAK